MNKPMIRRVTATLAVALALLQPAFGVYGASESTMLVNGIEKPLSSPVINQEGSVMVALTTLVSVLGSEANWNEAEHAIECNVGGVMYAFKPGSRLVTAGEAQKQLSREVLILEGRSYVPLNAVVDVFGGTLAKAESGQYVITIYTDQGKPYGQYTFEDLYQMALKNSVALRQAYSAYDKAEITYDEENDDFFETPSNNGDPTREAVRLANLLTMKSTEISLKTAEISTLTVKDQIRYQLQDLLNDTRVAEGAIELAEEELAVQRTLQAQNEIKFSHGLISSIEYDKSKETLKAKELAVGTKRSERDALIAKLDNLLKLGAENYVFLKHSPVAYEPLSNRNVNAHIDSIIQESPDIWSLEQVVKLKEYNVDYFVFNAGQIYETAEIDVTTAKQNVVMAKESTAVSLRELFEQINQLENSYATLQVEREKLLKDLTVARLNLQVGLVTQLTVDQLELAVHSLDQQLLSLKGSYSALKAAYLEPWAAQ